MSVQMNKPAGTGAPEGALSASIQEIARSHCTDKRFAEFVPGFDAPFFQAGLAGYSDGAMRLLAREHGCPFCITEALLDRTLINGGKGRRKEDPDLIATECGMGEPSENRITSNDDHPIAGQVMGTDPTEMAKAAAILVDMGYDVIDVNLACPVKKIRKHHRGGHFLSVPTEALEVLSAVRQAVPATHPCTLKVRRAFDDTKEMAHNFMQVFDGAYEMGYAWATVHCRTVQQKYKGPGRWGFLKDLTASRSDRLICGSGDIWEVQDIFAMLDFTNVQAVAVARGCIGNPWIFKQAKQLMRGESPQRPSLQEQREVLLRHFDLSTVIHGEQNASRMMRKFGIKFAAHHPSAPEQVKSAFVRCKNRNDWLNVMNEFYVDEGRAELLGEV